MHCAVVVHVHIICEVLLPLSLICFNLAFLASIPFSQSPNLKGKCNLVHV